MYIYVTIKKGINNAQNELQKERDLRKKLEETVHLLEMKQTSNIMKTNTETPHSYSDDEIDYQEDSNNDKNFSISSIQAIQQPQVQ